MISIDRSIVIKVIAVVFLPLLSPTVSAEKLPIKNYTTADGLGHNNVQRIVRDSRGFLWFCTFEGLSRFDGYSFTTYGTDQGLPSQVVNDLLETRADAYWVATDAGLCRFNPRGVAQQPADEENLKQAPTMFTVCFPAADQKSRQVKLLLEDREGVIWCATAGGLYRTEEQDRQLRFRRVELGAFEEREGGGGITAMVEDRRGALWIGAADGLYRILRDGRIESYADRNGLPRSIHIQALFQDREGRMWVASRLGGLHRLVSDPDPARNVVDKNYTLTNGLPTMWINQILQAADGSLWAGSAAGLIRFISNGGGDFRFRAYAQAQGLTSQYVHCLAENRNHSTLQTCVGDQMPD
jgi:ligand-binding sensor domain-containing protein